MREPTKFQCPNCGAEYKVVRVEAAATNDLDAAIQSATDSNRHAVRRHQTEEFSRLKYAALRCSDSLATLKRKRKVFARACRVDPCCSRRHRGSVKQ